MLSTAHANIHLYMQLYYKEFQFLINAILHSMPRAFFSLFLIQDVSYHIILCLPSLGSSTGFKKSSCFQNRTLLTSFKLQINRIFKDSYAIKRYKANILKRRANVKLWYWTKTQKTGVQLLTATEFLCYRGQVI